MCSKSTKLILFKKLLKLTFSSFFVLFLCILFCFVCLVQSKKQPKHSNVQSFTVTLTDIKIAAKNCDFFFGFGGSKRPKIPCSCQFVHVEWQIKAPRAFQRRLGSLGVQTLILPSNSGSGATLAYFFNSEKDLNFLIKASLIPR